MMARPEAVAGLVHNIMNGDLVYPIDSSLLTNSELLDRVVASNAKQNADTEGDSYLLSQVKSFCLRAFAFGRRGEGGSEVGV